MDDWTIHKHLEEDEKLHSLILTGSNTPTKETFIKVVSKYPAERGSKLEQQAHSNRQFQSNVILMPCLNSNKHIERGNSKLASSHSFLDHQHNLSPLLFRYKKQSFVYQEL